MERRKEPRFPSSLGIRITELDDSWQVIAGTVIDISESGLCALLPVQLVGGAPVQLEVGDAVLYGHIAHAAPDEEGFRTGIAVERVLLGNSDLSNILGALLETPEPQPPDSQVSYR